MVETIQSCKLNFIIILQSLRTTKHYLNMSLSLPLVTTYKYKSPLYKGKKDTKMANLIDRK